MNNTVQPNFFIIGAAKCATTSLASLLALHPAAGISRIKEPHYFSRDENYRVGWPKYLELFTHCAGKKAVGDASTSYSRIRYHKATVERIKAHVPDARIIYMVRHPLKRIESAYVENICTAGSPLFATLNDMIKLQPMIVDSSRYWEVFDAYRHAFEETKIKVIFFEEYIAGTVAAFQDVCRFLQIDDSVVPDLKRERVNSRDEAAARMAKLGRGNFPINTTWDETVRREVLDRLREDNCQLLAHFGKPKSFWGDLF